MENKKLERNGGSKEQRYAKPENKKETAPVIIRLSVFYISLGN